MTDLQRDPLTDKIIGCAIEVHKRLAPGLLESVYQSALCVEIDHHGLNFQCQVALPLKYRARLIGGLRLDIVLENSVILELKSAERMDLLFEAQLLTYLRLSDIKTGLLINFNSRLLHQGIKRFVL
jgi:GxxExxY protein